jgi:hypothetical protein
MSRSRLSPSRKSSDFDFKEVGEAAQLDHDLSAENTTLAKTLKDLLYYVKLSLLLICGLYCLFLFHIAYSSNDEPKKIDLLPKPVEILPNRTPERKKIAKPVEMLPVPYECKKFDLHPKPREILPNHPYGLWPGLANKIDLETGETLPGFHQVSCATFFCFFVEFFFERQSR